VSGGGDRARAYRLFAEALDYVTEAREQFLTRECGADLKLRAEVDALLLIATRDIAATGALLAPPGRFTEELAGLIYRHFRLTTRIGEGGMEVVYRAERTDVWRAAIGCHQTRLHHRGPGRPSAVRTRLWRKLNICASLPANSCLRTSEDDRDA